jgi:ATP-binding cassette subfamily B protein
LPQDPHLFSGSVEMNVRLSATDASGGPSLDRALCLASLDADLRTFPEGLQTEIGELGVRVSGGQRQRIGLARALAAAPRTPGLLVLDDPFSSVDVDTEARIVTALREAFGPAAPIEQRATIVLCSHRLLAFPQADQVLVLDDGHIVERGTHAELVASGGVYARIFQAQRRVEATRPLVEAAT